MGAQGYREMSASMAYYLVAGKTGRGHCSVASIVNALLTEISKHYE